MVKANSRTPRKFKTRQILALAACTMLVAGAGAGQARAEGEGPGCEGNHCIKWLQITSFDGTKIAANLYTPRNLRAGTKHPAVVMPASWGIPESQYEFKATQFADDGYIVLAYAARGFGGSEGFVDVAGPNSQQDNSVLIDWLIANTATDPQKIGMAGMSYGAGLGLLAAGLDPRVKAVVAISGWADLRHALYANDTVHELWLDIIMATGALTGRLDQSVFGQIERLKNHEAPAEIMAWADRRSATSVLSGINQRQVPIYMANSYEDNLFPPGQAVEFFTHLTGPKKFHLDHGIHCTSSLLGLAGFPNEIWDDGKKWLDQWLLGKDTGILQEEPVSFQSASGKSYFHDFPPVSEAQAVFPLQPLNPLTESSDQKAPKHPVIGFVAGIDSGASTGVPVLSDVGSGILQQPVQTMFVGINPQFAAIYQTNDLEQGGNLRGAARVHVPLEPHDGGMQLVAYLYDVSPWGVATLLTHGVASRSAAATDPTHLDITLNVTAYEIPAGDHLIVAIDSVDALYLAARTMPYWLEIAHNGNDRVTLELPLAP